MGTPGRKPRPPALKLLEGRGPGVDSGGRKVPASLGFVRLPPEPPYFLEGEALAEWNRIVPELARLELLKPVDSAALTAYCLAWQRLVDAHALVASEGLLSHNSQGRVRHPAVAVIEAASKDLRAWCSEFGLTPSAENRVTRPEPSDGTDENPFA
jgi:P27 family predicted phage terminase small subunit